MSAMFKVVEAGSTNVLGRFDSEEHARISGRTFSNTHYCVVVIVDEDAGNPIARYHSGEEIALTATIHPFA